jgi:FtsH-binding integral membrane protein
MPVVLYYLGVAFLFTHELDAMTHAEWRILPVLNGMSDATASPTFVALHVLLFFGIMWLSQHARERLRHWTRIVVGGFLIVHGVLHLSLSSTPEYDFHGPLSQVLIGGAAAFGAAFLLAGPLRGR